MVTARNHQNTIVPLQTELNTIRTVLSEKVDPVDPTLYGDLVLAAKLSGEDIETKLHIQSTGTLGNNNSSIYLQSGTGVGKVNFHKTVDFKFKQGHPTQSQSHQT